MNDWFEIFRTGKHTDASGIEREWSEEDVDKIVASYDPEKHEAPIVVGHPVANAPAFGWIEKLKRAGDRLLAYPKNVVSEFADAVKQGLFKKRSISLYPDLTLRHVGFLGAVPPAVKGLKDIEFNEEAENLAYEFNTVAELYDSENILEKTEPEEVKRSEYEALNLKFSEEEAKRKRAEEKLQELQIKMRLVDFKMYLAEKAAYGILNNKQTEKLMKLMEATETLNYSEDGKTVTDLIKDFVETLTPQYVKGELAVKDIKEEKINRSPAQIIADVIKGNQANY